MKLENTPENKARFFALYWGTKSVLTEGMHHSQIILVSHMNLEFIDNCFLLLTPLSQITDEDAIEIIKMQFDELPDGFKIIKFDRSFKDIPNITYSFINTKDKIGYSEISLLGGSKDFNRLSVRQTMFAIQHGYYVGDGTEIEYGWLKLKTS